MSGRISTLNMYNNSMRNITHGNSNLQGLTESMSSGTKAKGFNKVHNEAQFLLNINKEIQLANTYIKNATVVEMRTENMHTTTSHLLDVANYLGGELSRSTHHMHDEQLSQVAKHKLYEIKHELNTSIGGIYLLSGSMLEKPAVGDIESADSYYQGDDEVHIAQLGDFFELKYGVTAEEQSFTDLIIGTQLAMQIKDKPYALSQAKSYVEKSIVGLINLQQKISNDYSVAVRYKYLHEENKRELLQVRSKVESTYRVDLPELISEFTLQESVLQASQLILSKLMNLNLASALR